MEVQLPVANMHVYMCTCMSVHFHNQGFISFSYEGTPFSHSGSSYAAKHRSVVVSLLYGQVTTYAEDILQILCHGNMSSHHTHFMLHTVVRTCKQAPKC